MISGEEIWDCLVIGGGIAGLTLAISLARKQRRVLVLEKKHYPRPKVCGACLNQRALEVFSRLELNDVLDRCDGVSLDRIDLNVNGSCLKLPLPGGLAITRRTLDERLAETAIAFGVTIAQDSTASLTNSDGSEGYRSVRVRSADRPEQTIHAKSVVVAAGLGGVKDEGRSWEVSVHSDSLVGLGTQWTQGTQGADGTRYSEVEAGTIYLHACDSSYVGLVLAENRTVNLAAAVKPSHLKQSGSAGETVARLLRGTRWETMTDWSQLAWQGTVPLTRSVDRRAARRLLVLGDSAGYVEPFTGEGMAWALTGAMRASELLHQAIDRWEPCHETTWESIYSRIISRRQWSCRTIAYLLRHPRAARWALAMVRTFPELGRMIVRDLNRPLRESEGALCPTS